MNQAANEHYAVELITALDKAGNPFYAYLLLSESMLPALQRQIDAGDVDLEAFGVVLAHGEGHIPSEKHQQYIKQRFSTPSVA